ncbi:hypothetical protein JS531_10285 [Bifidobacterium sp. CP2]|uniref:hypothetical protein n=1 Tax=Bifidobacterium sp. CP2 TaxID=2809025 RepID=UPI001BDDB172|nr:hypothetical protein [Bifidobacterium sp. CP2]MBT1182325.1 hypothetical protein [Bifidobacterium sp. CP2]
MADFTDEELSYLNGLSAVHSVSMGRIRYEPAFRDECMRRYLRGESPVTIFREAGLGPEVIGRKRIERCFARWRQQLPKPLQEGIKQSRWCAAVDGAAGGGTAGDTHAAGRQTHTIAERFRTSAASYAAVEGRTVMQDPQALLCEYFLALTSADTDPRDAVIAQQAQRIGELQREIGRLQYALDGLTKARAHAKSNALPTLETDRQTGETA